MVDGPHALVVGRGVGELTGQAVGDVTRRGGDVAGLRVVASVGAAHPFVHPAQDRLGQAAVGPQQGPAEADGAQAHRGDVGGGGGGGGPEGPGGAGGGAPEVVHGGGGGGPG